MNYRHAFHAGNFADCVKHALLVAHLRLLSRKPAPFLVLDTHAGAGHVDLDSEAPARTGEWREGIGRLRSASATALADYLAVANRAGLVANLYPGSPALTQAMLRADDRLIACELHPEDATHLRRALGRDARCAVHDRDGYEAILALLPPRGIGRGLVLIDPPFEHAGEFGRLAEAIARARSRFPAAGVLAWYPIKSRAPSRDFHARLIGSGLRDLIAFELWLRAPLDPARLNGCGLIAAGPPFGLEDMAPALLAALLDRLGSGEDGAGTRTIRLQDE